MTTWTRYWHTIRHLKPIQVYGRVSSRLKPQTVDNRPPPAVRGFGAASWVIAAPKRIGMLGPRRFAFLNQIHELEAGEWDPAARDKLWRYNLHYFDDLNAADAHTRVDWHRDLMREWVTHNSPGAGTGWEPYPTSLRIVNWIKWALRGNQLSDACLASLAVQSRWLARRLETHLLGNHLFANAKALCFAGLFFEGDEATRWFDRGVDLLSAMIPEQILPDGGHFELSPMYHALALEDMLDLVNISNAHPRPISDRTKRETDAWRRAIPRMRRWLAAMTHPDGEIAFFNDAAIGVAPSLTSLDAYAKRLGIDIEPRDPGLTRLEASGYVRVEEGSGVVLLDVGRVGPDYLPAHAHADTLSFELSVGGQRVLVNSGTSLYESGAERLRQRGTAAHNALVIDGFDSSEVWSSFRVARRARPIGLEVTRAERTVVRCSHDGYGRLKGRPTHTRTWSVAPGAMTVTDVVSGAFHTAEARFHLHPAVRSRLIEATPERGSAELTLPGGATILVAVRGGLLRVESSTWHPEFGAECRNECLSALLNGPSLSTDFVWDDIP